MKRLLIVSPHFPPVNAPDMQRVRMSLPHYRAHGWEPVVLTVKPDRVDAVREPELLATVPSDVRIEACDAYPPERAGRLGVGNLGLRALPFLRRAGADLLRREPFDLVFFSTTQFSTVPLGRLWRRRFGVPYVVDLQDPWRTDYYSRPGSRRPPGGWKYGFARLQAALLEGWTLRRASGLISVSGHYIDDLRARYRGLAAPAAVIPFGTSRADLELARNGAAPEFARSRRPGEVHVVYTGSSGPVMPHALTLLFEALRSYAERFPETAKRLRFHFYGTSYVAPGKGRPTVLPLAQECGVAAFVDEVPHRLGHLESLRLQAAADVLLLAGSSDRAYSPSKLYPYYLTGKPILALVFRDSVLERLLDELNAAAMVRFTEGAARVEAHAALHRCFDAALAGFPPGTLPARNDAFFAEHYLAASLTQRQCELFEAAVSFRR